MKEQEENTGKRNLIVWLKEKTIQLWNTVKVWFSEKATNLWNLVMRKNLLWTLLFIVYFCFQSFFERLLTDYLVLPFLSSFEVTFFTRILFAVGVIYIIVRTCFALWNKEQISPSHLYIAFLLIFIWGYYRFYSDAFTFTYVIDNIAFVDIVALYAVLLYFTKLVVLVRIEISSIRNKKVNQSEGFVLDEPIHENPEEDILKRSPFAESIANKLLRTKLSERSFAIGIVAPWGYGKTSFVNLIKYHLGDRAIVMDYSPWVYGKGSNLTQAFFMELSKNLNCYNRSLNHQIKAYASLLGKTDSTLLQLLSSAYALFHQDESLETIKGTLEKTLQSIPKPIVVVVDDLDRLIGEEIMEVLRLMRNGASFPNLYFIAAYDKNYIVKTISEQNKVIMPDAYLEKIFQVEYAIPQFEKEVLRNVLFESCSKFMMSESDIKELDEAVNDSRGFRKFVMGELRTLRDVKRFTNALYSSYPHLAGEIVLKDLMNITLLKVKYKEVFDILAKYQTRLFKTTSSGVKVLFNKPKKSDEVEIEKSFIHKEPIDLEQDWDIYLGNIYTEEQKDDILFILKRIFPKSKRIESLKGVNTEDGFERYFYDTLLEENFSASEFNKLWNLTFDEIRRRLKITLLNKSLSLQSQLKSYKPINSDIYMKWVRMVFFIGTNSKKNIFEMSELKTILDVPSFWKDTTDSYRQFLLQILRENNPSLFVCKFLASLEKDSDRQYKTITKEEARGIRISMFRDVVDEDEVSALDVNDYMDCMKVVEWISLDEFHEIYLPKAKTIYKEYAGKHVIPLLTSMIVLSGISGDMYCYYISPRAKWIWDSWENFERFVHRIKTSQVNHDMDSDEMDEFIRFMDKCKSRGWERGVVFKFEYLNIRK